MSGSFSRSGRMLIAVGALFVGVVQVRALFELQGFGAGEFTIAPEATSSVSYSQSQDALTFTGSQVLGDALGGIFNGAAQDWSPYAGLGLRMTLTGANPNVPFSVQFYDDAFEIIGLYIGTTVGLNEAPGIAWLSFVSSGAGNMASVVGMQFTWDSANSINLSLNDVVGLAPPTSGLFVARVPGGVLFLTGQNTILPHADSHATSLPADGTQWNPPIFGASASLPEGATSWALLSDSNAKTEVTAVDPREILSGLAELPVSAWRYKGDVSRRYLGPMAQDFRELFGLGGERTISTIDADGVALAALQALAAEFEVQKTRSAAQAERLRELEAQWQELQERWQGRAGTDL